MQKPDFLAVVEPVLHAQQPALTGRLQQLFADFPTANHFLFEYLLGLDHAVLGYARRPDDTDLNADATLFVGFAGYLAELRALDATQHTHFEHDFRSDEQVAARLDDWFAACWSAAGGPALPVPSYYMYEGDSSRFNLQTNEWE